MTNEPLFFDPLHLKPGTITHEYKTLIRAELLTRVDGDAELLSDLIATFQAESPRLLTRIRLAIAARDSRELFSSAHACKGVLQTLSANLAADVACQLEVMGAAGIVLGAEELLVELDDEIVQLLIELPLLDSEFSRLVEEKS